jgi:hypothetical protein
MKHLEPTFQTVFGLVREGFETIASGPSCKKRSEQWKEMIANSREVVSGKDGESVMTTSKLRKAAIG